MLTEISFEEASEIRICIQSTLQMEYINIAQMTIPAIEVFQKQRDSQANSNGFR